MDAQYPNATEEDVGRLGDRVCIICREEMIVAGSQARQAETETGGEGGEGQTGEQPGEPTPVQTQTEDGPNETPKKLVCGHVFHFHCLRSWLERQQSCPTWYVPLLSSGIELTCSRRDVLHTTPTTRQRRPVPPPAAAPAPAPGGVPQVGNNVELREQYNEFFRIPNENGAIPTPPPPPAPAATNGLTAGPTQPAPPTTVETTEEDRIQTSIWGGPIQPGRFFAPPLGSIRRVQPPAQARAGPSRPVPIPIRTAVRHHLDLPPPSAFPTPAPGPYGFNGPIIPPSEATTPFSSNPPEVFRSMSSESDEALSGAGLGAGSGSASGNGIGQGEEVEIESGRGNRRLAAEAAMRRMGLVRPGMKGKEKEKEKSIPESVPVPTIETKETKDTKQETYTPYLSPLARSAPHSTTDRSPWSKRGSVDNLYQPQYHAEGRGGTREGVDERLKTLKRVDDTIWGLVEELTRIRSLMDVEAEEREREMVDRMEG
jgi:E3 ubiquitin-protein ligase synoviolin